MDIHAAQDWNGDCKIIKLFWKSEWEKAKSVNTELE